MRTLEQIIDEIPENQRVIYRRHPNSAVATKLIEREVNVGPTLAKAVLAAL